MARTDQPTAVTIRPASAADLPFLWRVLSLAASMDGTADAIAAAKSDPTLTPYVDGYPRDSDVGFVAEREGVAVGAAWVRCGTPRDGKVWTLSTPELVIASTPDARGGGVGTALLRAIIEASRGRFSAIALSVREGNRAVRLYERVGFDTEKVIVNRVGGRSLAMRLCIERPT